MKKKIKEVNGVKVIQRHSLGSIFYAIFCLLLVAIPVTMLFIPWFKITATDGTDTYVASLTAINLIKDVFIGQIMATGSVFTFLITQLITSSGLSFLTGFLPYIIPIIAFALPIFYAIVAFFAIFFLFFALELLFRGRMGHLKAPYVLAWFYFLTVLFFSGLGVALPYLINLLYNLVSSPSFTIDMTLWGGDWASYMNYIYIGVAFISLIALGVIHRVSFKNRIFIGDIGDLSRNKKQIADNVETDISQVAISNAVNEELIKKVVQTPAIGLPPTIRNIGGHAFSENLNLIVAIIPLGIKTLGRGAFANCGHLKLVSLPISIKAIGTNCFFNCANLQRINYAGTKEQWRHVRRGPNWLTKAGTTTVVCVDGPILVNPYH
jgi:hypothetical protein